MLQHQWRVTKYDPAMRTSGGHFIGKEWTEFGQLAAAGDEALTKPEQYLQAEDRYVRAVERFLSASGVDEITVEGLELLSYKPNETDTLGLRMAPFVEGQVLSAAGEAGQVCRLVLRNYLWCRLIAENSGFVHFGWDYYMYIGSGRPCENAVTRTIADGLFVEPFTSPHHQNAEE